MSCPYTATFPVECTPVGSKTICVEPPPKSMMETVFDDVPSKRPNSWLTVIHAKTPTKQQADPGVGIWSGPWANSTRAPLPGMDTSVRETGVKQVTLPPFPPCRILPVVFASPLHRLDVGAQPEDWFSSGSRGTPL